MFVGYLVYFNITIHSNVDSSVNKYHRTQTTRER